MTTGSFSLTAPSATDATADPDGVVLLSGTSRTGETIEAFLPVTMLYKLPIPDFKGSRVYNLFLEGDMVGEICREYIPVYSENSQATVIYPYSGGQYATGRKTSRRLPSVSIRKTVRPITRNKPVPAPNRGWGMASVLNC